MKKAIFVVVLCLVSKASMSSKCWTSYLMTEIVERQNLLMSLEENSGDIKKEKTIYSVVSDLSEYIFIGEAMYAKKTTVREKGTEESLFSIDTVFSVLENIKGELNLNVLVRSGEVEDCGCIYNFEPGVEYLVIANKRKDKLVTYYCNYIGPKEYAFIEEFKKVNK